ncbi:MAG: LysR family transcriptional regulator [Xanthobacteraceae bacterium]
MPWNERTKRRLKLRNLDMLMAIAETGSMGKAADRLNTSQPAISKAIVELENAVGVRLVDRSRRGVVATSYGQALIKRGVAVFDELQQGLEDIKHLSDPTTGEARVGATDRITAAIVVPVIDRLSRQYPRMRFRVATGESAQLIAALDARNVEFVIHRMPPQPSDEHSSEILFLDDLVVVTGAKNPLARRRRIALADLMDEPWVLVPADSYAGSWQVSVFAAAGLQPPRHTVEATSSFTLRSELLATQRFFTVTTRFSLMLPRKNPELTALPIDLRGAPQPIGIVTLKKRSLGPAAQLFIEHVRKLTKPLSKSN